MSIQVGVRVRPFNTREKEHHSECIIEMPGQNQTRIKDEVGKERTFTFGDEIVYQPENGFASEQERILKEAYNQLLFLSGIAASAEEYSAGEEGQ